MEFGHWRVGVQPIGSRPFRRQSPSHALGRVMEAVSKGKSFFFCFYSRGRIERIPWNMISVWWFRVPAGSATHVTPWMTTTCHRPITLITICICTSGGWSVRLYASSIPNVLNATGYEQSQHKKQRHFKVSYRQLTIFLSSSRIRMQTEVEKAGLGMAQSLSRSNRSKKTVWKRSYTMVNFSFVLFFLITTYII